MLWMIGWQTGNNLDNPGQLREAGIDATTLQSFLARGENHPSADPANRYLYLLDESSLASTM